MIQIDVMSDPICPWCLIGKRRLDVARAARPDVQVALRWKPFQLNPDRPADGMDRRAYLEAKFGGPEGAAQVYRQIAEIAASEGLSLNFDAVSRTPNTMHAHRLLRLASRAGVADDAAEGLFHAYFVMGEDIGDAAVLLRIATEVGVDPGLARDYLSGTADVDAIRAEDDAARSMGATGAPTWVIGGRHVVAGAQSAETWVGIFDELAARGAA